MGSDVNSYWDVPVELSAEEESICARCKRTGRLYAFLRRHRHSLFDEEFQTELLELYSDTARGRPPIPPALLAMVTILQAADGISDAGAVNEALFDRRWQMVLGCSGTKKAPFSQGVLVDFRRRLQAQDKHIRLIERSVELAKLTGGFGYKQLRVALDSAPLWGAGRVEDTFNLIAHALEVVVSCASAVAGVATETVREQAQLTLIGQSSLKAALDIDWDDPNEQHHALQRLLSEVQQLQRWLAQTLSVQQLETSSLKASLDQLRRVIEQDLEPEPDGQGQRIARRTAKERQVSIHDPSMRHGRKSRSKTIKGFKRFIAKELEHGLILGVDVQPANRPEREAIPSLRRQLENYGEVEALYIDRGFLASDWVTQLHQSEKTVVCKPWVARNGAQFSKQAFKIELEKGTVRCPAGHEKSIKGKVIRFPASACDPCPKRAQCTRAKPGRGRTLQLHANEALHQKLHASKKTSEGRVELRKRVGVEHSLAHICNRQGPRARYVGLQKNIFDLCRYAVIENCFAAARFERAAA